MLLNVKNLSKTVKNRVILSDVSFEVNEGEIVGLVGPNGAGKTTTIKACLGLCNFDSGTISCNSLYIKKDFTNYMQNVCGILDHPNLYSNLTAFDNLAIQSRLYRINDRNRIEKALELVGLQNRSKDRVKTFSLGMKQRLNLARAFLIEPKLLFLDEPFNGIDPEGMVEIRKLLKQLNKEKNTAIIISSHLLSEVEKICSRVICIKSGKTKGVIDLSQIEEVVLIMITSDNAYAKLCIEENYKYPVELQKDSLNIKVVIKRHDFNSIIECIKGNNISIYDIKTENPLENQYLALMGGNIID